jgi:hypothetical protein
MTAIPSTRTLHNATFAVLALAAALSAGAAAATDFGRHPATTPRVVAPAPADAPTARPDDRADAASVRFDHPALRAHRPERLVASVAAKPR